MVRGKRNVREKCILTQKVDKFVGLLLNDLLILELLEVYVDRHEVFPAKQK